jgi:hypothetical protein
MMRRGTATKKVDPPLGPTPEQAARSRYELGDIVDKDKNGRTVEIRKAYTKVRVLEALNAQGLFSEAEYKALAHYRHHADIADKSPLRDSLLNLGRVSTGSGNGPTITTLNAIRVRDDCDRAAGSLVDILRAVIVDDTSLSQWCISRGHSSEKYRPKRGWAIEAKDAALRIAQVEIKMVAKWVQAELDA